MFCQVGNQYDLAKNGVKYIFPVSKICQINNKTKRIQLATAAKQFRKLRL